MGINKTIVIIGPSPNFMNAFLKVFLNADDLKLQKRFLYCGPVCSSWRPIQCMACKDANINASLGFKKLGKQIQHFMVSVPRPSNGTCIDH